MVATVAMLAVIACGGGEPEPTPIPTPTPIPPTPTPVPSLQPISVSPDEDPLAFLAALPASERDCIAQAIGATGFQGLFAGEEATDDESRAALGCLSNETFQRIIVGQAIGETGVELSDATLACIDNRLSAVDFQQLGRQALAGDPGEDLNPEDALNVGLSVLPAIFCLNDDERAALATGAAGPLGLELSGATVDALECVFDAAGPDGLASFVTIADESDAPSPELIAALGRILSQCADAFADSGLLDLVGEGGAGGLLPEGIELPPELQNLLGGGDGTPVIPELPGITSEEALGISAEVMACLEGSLPGEELAQLNAMLASGAPPTAAIILAVAQCGEGAAAEAGIQLPLSAENLACLINEIGEERVDALLRGEAGFDLSLIGAVSTCGLDLTSFGN